MFGGGVVALYALGPVPLSNRNRKVRGVQEPKVHHPPGAFAAQAELRSHGA